MGIRFNCPHCGRALNVKAAQAGLEGICPFCRQNVTIVADSPLGGIVAPVPSGISSGGGFEVDEQITHVGLDPVIRQESDERLVEYSLPEASPQRPDRRFKPLIDENGKDVFLLDKPVPPVYRDEDDPLAEAPNLVWYYRTRNQRERGPLRAKSMKEEIETGKVVAGCIVWREDWEVWLPAEQVFSRLMVDSAVGEFPASEGALKGALVEFRQYFARQRVIVLSAIVLGFLLFLALIVTLYFLVKT